MIPNITTFKLIRLTLPASSPILYRKDICHTYHFILNENPYYNKDNSPLSV